MQDGHTVAQSRRNQSMRRMMSAHGHDEGLPVEKGVKQVLKERFLAAGFVAGVGPYPHGVGRDWAMHVDRGSYSLVAIMQDTGDSSYNRFLSSFYVNLHPVNRGADKVAVFVGRATWWHRGEDDLPEKALGKPDVYAIEDPADIEGVCRRVVEDVLRWEAELLELDAAGPAVIRRLGISYWTHDLNEARDAIAAGEVDSRRGIGTQLMHAIDDRDTFRRRVDRLVEDGSTDLVEAYRRALAELFSVICEGTSFWPHLLTEERVAALVEALARVNVRAMDRVGGGHPTFVVDGNVPS